MNLTQAETREEPAQTVLTFFHPISVLLETTIPRIVSVVKGVVGGSVAMLCPYNPKDKNTQKYWCRWNEQTSGCPQLVSSQGLVKEQSKPYEGRLVLHEEPGNGTYTVILNQLTSKDAGFYWCLTTGDPHWWFTVELKIVEGKPQSGGSIDWSISPGTKR